SDPAQSGNCCKITRCPEHAGVLGYYLPTDHAGHSGRSCDRLSIRAHLLHRARHSRGRLRRYGSQSDLLEGDVVFRLPARFGDRQGDAGRRRPCDLPASEGLSPTDATGLRVGARRTEPLLVKRSGWTLVAAVALPIIVLIGVSLNAGIEQVFPPRGLSVRWY